MTYNIYIYQSEGGGVLIYTHIIMKRLEPPNSRNVLFIVSLSTCHRFPVNQM